MKEASPIPVVGVLLLSAGSSSRLGRPKQLLPYEGQSLLRRAATTAVAAVLGPVVVVTGALHAELLPELTDLPVQVVHCPTWQTGMGASLKAGLSVLEHHQPALTSILVLLCDQPHVTPTLLRQLVVTQLATQQPIVAAEYGSVRGVPVLFAESVLPLLRALPDAAGAQQLLRQHPEWVATVPFPAGAVDVDTEAQYAALLRGEEIL
ncbi:nucleotidyltransferase family protein [Hymenobacter aerilatus]|uniref:Nucleotidyltransferase family protein n=1 Tax=Hymenobacter aerilatus TaxID=2932251 RepID=A0A8T9SNA6_9BACT|nr:nucleotidyltransferase family protein [Hymenobacter aerilatus]UOR03588.1 nucleotidyltransferase family protein [Hymenobacter aerilatus]